MRNLLSSCLPEGVAADEGAPDQPDRVTRNLGRLLVTIVVALGLGLRLWGITWSLPDQRHPITTYHPDELVNLHAAEEADLAHGKLDIGFYNYGAFYFYLVSVVETAAHAYHIIPTTATVEIKTDGQAESQPDKQAAESAAILRRQAPEQAGKFLVGRILTALMGAGTVLVLYGLGSCLYDRRIGLLAALFYAVAPLAVVHSHFLTVDVPSTLFVTLALSWGALILRRPSWRQIVLGGVWCGLAAATKYTAGLCIVGPVTAVWLTAAASAGTDRGLLLRNAGVMTGILLACATCVFLVACPGIWVNSDAFTSAVQYELFEHARAGHGNLFVNTGPGWWFHLHSSLRHGLGLPLLTLAVLGVIHAAARHCKADIVLLVFLIVAYASTSFSAVRFARYLIPLFPALCLLAASASLAPFSRSSARFIAMAFGAIAGLYCLLTSAALSRAMAAEDPRDRVADALIAKVRPGASIGFAHIPWFYSPPLSPSWGAMNADVRAHAGADPVAFQLRIPNGAWETRVLTPLPDFVVVSNIEVLTEWMRLRLPAAVEFMDTVTANYVPTDYRPTVVPGIDPEDPNTPEDLLYVLPEITVYRRKR